MNTTSNNHPPTIGVLALQGAFLEHIYMLRTLGACAVEVRRPAQIEGLDGLIIPGGESTSIGLIASRWGLVEPLRAWVRARRPTWGTCAGMILLADRAAGQKQGGQALIGGLDVTVSRNHFGRQVQSFETDLPLPAPLAAAEEPPFPAIFIRAPAIIEVGNDVRVLARVHTHDGQEVIAAVQQGPLLATAFHPELTNDLRWHRYFVEQVVWG